MKFAIKVLNLASSIPKNYSSQVLSHQIVRSATSAGASYRAACRSKSRKDFINKLKIVEEELDETSYWLEVIAEINLFPRERISPLIDESNELLSIIVKSIQTAKVNGLARNKRMANPGITNDE